MSRTHSLSFPVLFCWSRLSPPPPSLVTVGTGSRLFSFFFPHCLIFLYFSTTFCSLSLNRGFFCLFVCFFLLLSLNENNAFYVLCSYIGPLVAFPKCDNILISENNSHARLFESVATDVQDSIKSG